MTLGARDKIDGEDLLQAIRPAGAKFQLTTAAASDRVGPIGPTVSCIRVKAIGEDMYILQGDATVEAAASTGIHLTAGTPEYLRSVPGEYIAAIWVTAEGTLEVNEGDNATSI